MANQTVQPFRKNTQGISKFQLTRGQWQAGMTEQNHLTTAALTEPILSETVGLMFGFLYKNPFQILMSTMGGTEYVGNRQFQWRLMGDSEKSVPVTLAGFEGTPNLGQYRTTFKVGFDEKYFGHKDFLRSDNGTIVRVCAEPYHNGTKWIYTLELAYGDSTDYILSTQVALGSEFSKEYTPVSEYDFGGYTTSATPFELRNQLTTIVKSDAITRSAATDVMIVRLPNPENPGQTTDMWVSYREWLFLQQWYREKERMFMYSRYNSNSLGETHLTSDNGRPIYIGAGIEEMIEMGERREYSGALSETIIQEFLSNLSYNRKDMGDRKYVALTGEYGMIEFHNAMKDSFQDWNISDASFTIKGDNMNLTFGSQFKKYTGLNGVELTLMHFPLYDNTTMHRTLDPISKKPLESYKFTILDFGGINGGSSNVTKVVKKDSEDLMWHVAGSISPTGPAKSLNTLRANNLDGYSIHAITEMAPKILDPTACGQLVRTLG